MLKNISGFAVTTVLSTMVKKIPLIDVYFDAWLYPWPSGWLYYPRVKSPELRPVIQFRSIDRGSALYASEAPLQPP